MSVNLARQRSSSLVALVSEIRVLRASLQARNKAFNPKRPLNGRARLRLAITFKVSEFKSYRVERKRGKSTAQCRSCCVNFLGLLAVVTFAITYDARTLFRVCVHCVRACVLTCVHACVTAIFF